jgi:hypothetical protein
MLTIYYFVIGAAVTETLSCSAVEVFGAINHVQFAGHGYEWARWGRGEGSLALERHCDNLELNDMAVG